MGTVLRTTDDSLRSKVKLMPIMDCCDFAHVILKGGKTLIKQNLAKKMEFNSKLWSEQYQSSAALYLSNQKNLNGYSSEDISFCHAPEIRGGDNYNVYLKKISENKQFGFDIFKCSVGIKLNNYCCYFVRTTVLHPTKQIRTNHAFIISVYQNLLQNLRDGVELCKAYEDVQSFAKKKNKNLAKHLEKEFGFELKSDFKNDLVKINIDSKVIAQKGMLFAVNINLIGLEENGIEYSLYYSDTIIVQKDNKSMRLIKYKATKSKVK